MSSFGSRKRKSWESDDDEDDSDYYIQLAKDSSHQPVVRGFAETTEIKDEQLWKIWVIYCQKKLKTSPEQAMTTSSLGTWLGFFQWYLSKRQISQKTARNYAKCLDRICYTKTGARMPQEQRMALLGALGPEGHLTRLYSLSSEMRSKETVSIDDFWDLLHVIWSSARCSFVAESLRVQFHFYLLIAAYTGSRPGALLGRENKQHKIVHFLTWRDCRLTLVPREDRTLPPLICLEVAFGWTKGGKGQVEANRFLFHEVQYPALCPIFFFLSMACAHKAFAVSDLSTPTAIHRLRVPSGLNEMVIPFRDDILDTAIWRAPRWRKDGGWELSLDPISQRAMTSYIHRACKAATWGKILTTYSLRRSTGNAIDKSASIAIRNQVMGHTDGGVYERHYRTQQVRCDVQNVFLGIPSEDRLLDTTFRVGRSADPRLPHSLDENDWQTIFAEDKAVRDIHVVRLRLKKMCLEKYGFLKTAKAAADDEGQQGCNGQGSISSLTTDDLLTVSSYHIFYRFIEAGRRAKNERWHAARRYLQQKVDLHRKEVPIQDIQKQLDGIAICIPEDDSVLANTTSRGIITAMLFQMKLPATEDKDVLQSRSRAMEQMLCHWAKQEPAPPDTGKKRLRPTTTADGREDSVETATQVENGRIGDTLTLPATTCLHCYFGGRKSKDASVMSRHDALQRHAQRAHFSLDASEGSVMACPHPLCRGSTFGNLEHFKRHAFGVHGVRY